MFISINECSKSCAKILEKTGMKINYYDVTKLRIKKVPSSINFAFQEVKIDEKFIIENLNSI